MAVYVAAALDALIYLGAVPLCAAFSLTTRGGLRLGVGFGAFGRRAALRRAVRAARAPGLRRGGGGPSPAARRVLARLRVDAFALRGQLCLGDAAATALACGALEALAAALGTRAARVELSVAPIFDSDAPSARLQGMISARAGQIMIAAARGGLDEISGRIAQWKDTRSKAS